MKRTLFHTVAPLLGAAVAVLVYLVRGPIDSAPIFGFTADGAVAEHQLERRFLALPDADRIRDAHRLLTAKPHLAGSPRDRELAEWTRERAAWIAKPILGLRLASGALVVLIVAGLAVTLAYPQLVALKQAERKLKDDSSPAAIQEARLLFRFAKNSKDSIVARTAAEIEQGLAR